MTFLPCAEPVFRQLHVAATTTEQAVNEGNIIFVTLRTLSPLYM